MSGHLDYRTDSIQDPGPDHHQRCVVCRKQCGGLNADTKSWSCAGRLATSTSLARALEDRMDTPGKREVRDMMASIVENLGGWRPRVLDLWGGGASARLIRERVPEAEVWSAERDPALWPALRADARRHGYTAVLGSTDDLWRRPERGGFNVVWMDLCGQASGAFMRTLVHARGLMPEQPQRPSVMAVTVMPEREADPFLVKSRAVSIPGLLAQETGLEPMLMRRYDRRGGHEMYVVVLAHRGRWYHTDHGYGWGQWDPRYAGHQMERTGSWAAHGWEGYLPPPPWKVQRAAAALSA